MTKTVFQYRYGDIDLRDINIPDYIVRDIGVEEMDSLTESIKKHGLINPLIVNELDDDSLELIGGQRRLTALGRTGREKAPCKIYNVMRDVARALSIADNLHRKDYTTKELASIYQTLINMYNDDIEAVAKEIGKKPAEIRRVLQAQGLSEAVLQQSKEIKDKKIRNTVEQRLPTIGKDERKLAAIQIIKDRNADEFDAIKIIRAIKENPNEDPKVVVDREFDVADMVGIQLKLKVHVNKALALCAVKKGYPKHVVAAEFVEKCLREEGEL